MPVALQVDDSVHIATRGNLQNLNGNLIPDLPVLIMVTSCQFTNGAANTDKMT